MNVFFDLMLAFTHKVIYKTERKGKKIAYLNWQGRY